MDSAFYNWLLILNKVSELKRNIYSERKAAVWMALLF